MRRILVLLLILPLALAAELDDFLSANPSVPVNVDCGGTYTLYPYSRNGALDYILVVQNDQPVFDFQTYRRVVSAYLYKEHIASSADNIRLLNPSAVPTFSSLLSKMKDEEYDISVARSVAENCFPQFVSQIDTMDSVRSQIVSQLDSFVERLGSSSRDLVSYMKSPDVRCDFSADVGVYDQFSSIVDLLSTYESYSKQLRANIAVTETNCSPDVIQSAVDALKPPYSSDQLQYFTSSAAAEKEIFLYSPSDEEIRTLLRRTITEYWRTLYEEKMNEQIQTDFGVFTLRDAVKYILGSNVPWRRKELVKTLSTSYSRITSLAANGNYEEAYQRAEELRKTVETIFNGGVAVKESGGIPTWAYAAVIIIGGIILWKVLGGRGGNEEGEEDTYDYDYA